MGTVQKVSKKSIDIQASGGEKTTLRIVPETLVTVDGQSAKSSQIKEGQEVRASYNTVEGKPTAVRIEAGMSSSGMGSSGSSTGSGSMGSSTDPSGSGVGSTDPGSTGSGTTGSSSGSQGSGATDSAGSGGTGSTTNP
jgi:hypothetical protein